MVNSSPQVFKIKKAIKKLNKKFTNDLREEIFSLYQKLWDRVRLYYKNAARLLPVVIYIVLKMKGLPINSKEIINSSILTQKQLNY